MFAAVRRTDAHRLTERALGLEDLAALGRVVQSQAVVNEAADGREFRSGLDAVRLQAQRQCAD